MLTAEQIAARQNFLGGSDIAWMLGLYSAYTHDDGEPKTDYTLWQVKTGQRGPDAPNKNTKRGDKSEEANRLQFSHDTGLIVVPPTPVHYTNTEHPFMGCNVDGIIAGHDGSSGVFEAKDVKDPSKLAEKRLGYELQLLHNMIVTDLTWGFISVKLPNKWLVFWRVEKDEEQAAQLIELERRFFAMVTAKAYRKDWRL